MSVCLCVHSTYANLYLTMLHSGRLMFGSAAIVETHQCRSKNGVSPRLVLTRLQDILRMIAVLITILFKYCTWLWFVSNINYLEHIVG